MNRHILLLCSLLSIQFALADEVYIPNLKKNATGTTTGAKTGLDVYISGGALGSVLSGDSFAVGDEGQVGLAVRKDVDGALVSADQYGPLQTDANGRLKVDAAVSEVATAADAGVLPALTKVISGYDGSNVQVVKTDNTGSVQVDVESSALPSGAATSAHQLTAQTTLDSLDTKLSSQATAAKQDTAQASLTSIDGKITAVNTGAVVVASSALPSGAATSAKQDTEITSLASIDGKITAVNTGAVVVASSALPSGAATEAKQDSLIAKFGTLGQKTMAGSAPVVLASDQAAIPVSQSGTFSVRTQDGSGNATTSSSAGSTRPIDVAVRDSAGNLVNPVTFGTSGSQSNTTVSTVATLTAPANAMGFLLMNLDTSSANIRWAVGATASASVGSQLQPGRDTGFVPAGANVSICAESGTQNYSVQWVVK